ncbi:MAG: hypothetical protein M1823_004815 [Watsoniomyces obsoletus]|nr:MAG: hypothetical protein M1823_004815 [Watsoniomyces obsoletus]
MKASQRYHRALTFLLTLTSISMDVSYGAASLHQHTSGEVGLTDNVARPSSNDIVIQVDSDGSIDVSRSQIHVETKPSRLHRRAGRRPKYDDEELIKAGMKDEEIKRYSAAKEGVRSYELARREGRLGSMADPMVVGKLREARAVYKRMIELVEAVMSGDPRRIQKARDFAELEYQPRAYPDELLHLALGDPKLVSEYKEYRKGAEAWDKASEASHGAGGLLQDELLTTERGRLRQAYEKYEEANRRIKQFMAGQTSQELEGRLGNYNLDELKSRLDLKTLADLNKGRRLSVLHVRTWKAANKRIGGMERILRERGEANPKAKVNELLLAKRRYLNALDVIYGKLEEARRGGNTDGEVQSARLDTEGNLFKPEEERRIKQVVNDLYEIEDLVDGKRAEREMKVARASILRAQRENQTPPVTQEQLNDLQRRINRYKELQKVVEQRLARLPQGSQDQGVSSAKRRKKNLPTNDDDLPPPPPIQQHQEQQTTQRHQEQAQQLQHQPSSTEAEEQGRRQPKQIPEPKHANNPLHFVANPGVITNQVQEKWKQLGNGQWQDLPRTIVSQVSERAGKIGGSWIGSLTRKGPPRVPIPGGIKVPPLSI